MEKEYYYDKLIFEGEYLNGERNGKGKEYNTIFNEYEFEGEYLKGKRWNGKFKAFKYFGEYKGYYINGVEKKEN